MSIPPPDSIVLDADRILNTYDTDTDFAFGPDDHQRWNLAKFLEQIEISNLEVEDDGLEVHFDISGVQAPIVNALRRVLLSELPTMAIEKVFLYQNTSLIQDEVLAHRLGLIPISADPRLFDWPNSLDTKHEDSEPELNEKQNLVFQLKVDCVSIAGVLPTVTDPKDRYSNSHVYSQELKWHPIGNQESWLSYMPQPVAPDILIAKLRPGQQLEFKCVCVKGIGRDHAKFSPVATASYKFLPQVQLKRKIVGDEAKRLKKSFSPGVIKLLTNDQGEMEARVGQDRLDSCSRNVLRDPDLVDAVLLTRKKNHIIFSIESTGALKASELLAAACQVLEEKCDTLLDALQSVCEDQIKVDR